MLCLLSFSFCHFREKQGLFCCILQSETEEEKKAGTRCYAQWDATVTISQSELPAGVMSQLDKCWKGTKKHETNNESAAVM